MPELLFLLLTPWQFASQWILDKLFLAFPSASLHWETPTLWTDKEWGRREGKWRKGKRTKT